jgi:putative DNA primase/helicase
MTAQKIASPAADQAKTGRGSSQFHDNQFSFDSQTIFETIPAELRERNQWVAWKAVPHYEQKTLELKPKPKKVPLDVKTERGAQTDNPRTWTSFDSVMGFIEEWTGEEHTHIDGKGAEITGTVSEYPGFVFAADDPFCGIDLDNCRNLDTGMVETWALKIIEQFKSYTELSQSGTGFHILIIGRKPADSGCKKGDIECYDKGRFFICTGEVFNDI